MKLKHEVFKGLYTQDLPLNGSNSILALQGLVFGKEKMMALFSLEVENDSLDPKEGIYRVS